MHLYCDWKKLKVRFRVCGKDSLKTAALSTHNPPPSFSLYALLSFRCQTDGRTLTPLHPSTGFRACWNRTAEEHVSYTRGDKERSSKMSRAKDTVETYLVSEGWESPNTCFRYGLFSDFKFSSFT